MFATGKLGLLQTELEGTQMLLGVTQERVAILEQQLENTQKALRLQQTNTGAFWESTRAAERKLKAIKELVEGEDESRWIVRGIKRVLDGE